MQVYQIVGNTFRAFNTTLLVKINSGTPGKTW